MKTRAREFMADTTPQTDAVVVAQPVSAPLTRAAIFLVVTINKGEDDVGAVRSFCADFAGLVRAVEFRDLEAGLSCVMGIGSG
jgi:putative iron-dependent peroxidase